MPGGTHFANRFNASDVDGYEQNGVQIGWSWLSVRLATVGDVALVAGACPANADGVAVVAGDRIGVFQQTDLRQNGIYTVVTPGAGGTWVRSDDADLGGQFTPGKTVYVESGSTLAQRWYQFTVAGAIVLGASNLVFSSASAAIANTIFVDKGSDSSQDGSLARPFHTLSAAVAAASFGDTIAVFPGDYAETGLVSKAGVTWQGIGEGQVSVSGAGTVLAVTHPSVYRNILFAVTDAAPLITLVAAAGVAFDHCIFSLNGNNANAISVGGSSQVEFIDCTTNQTAANFDVITADATPTNSIVIRRGAGLGVVRVSDGALTVEDVPMWSGGLFHSGTGALRVTNNYISGPGPINHTTTGSVYIQSNRLESLTGYAIEAMVSPSSGVLVDNVLQGALGDFAADTANIVYTMIQGNTCSVGFIQIDGGILSCAAAKVKNVGGPVDRWATLSHAVAAAASGQIVLVNSGNWVVDSPVVLKDGVVIRGVDRKLVTVSADEGFAAFDMTGADNVTASLEDMTIFGSVDVTVGAGSYYLHMDNIHLRGTLDLQSGSANTVVHCTNSKIVGNDTDQYPVRVAAANPYMYFMTCFLQGNGVEAVYYDGVTNNNLYFQGGCKVAHGSLGANLPFGRSAAQTPSYHSDHNGYNADPNNPPGPGFMVNLVPLGNQYDSFDPACIYWPW